MDVVLVATGYLVGLAIGLTDPIGADLWPRYFVSLAQVLPLLAVVHLAVNGLAGVYRRSESRPPGVSVGTTIMAATVAVLLILAWNVALTTRILPMSAVLFGGLATMLLMVLAQFGRSMGRELSERISPTT